MSDSEFDAASLDDVIHSKLRLGIMAYLSGVDSATFGELKERTGATDGNLSVSLRKLEDAGYIGIDKRFVGRRPQTRARLTDSGRKAWMAYLDQMRSLLG
ncbi:MAG: transcriptional regulator [Maricaulis sp.]|jgi:DNA-binding MarR family transcriptional regulator|nr:transcriptional regulator [Maricaulis sp.]MAL11446.1 transcriptional regulator [Maricaulis sp.]HAQ34805.1 transcriptional regulator [Alphaproteobacteria bacterium]HAV49565.1 transcriptional regulator [Brevundimonas sp.]|tara:strand:- start:288 stop:587 length:300 start_codon:yes stop_codon:yes gene_type:complete